MAAGSGGAAGSASRRDEVSAERYPPAPLSVNAVRRPLRQLRDGSAPSRSFPCDQVLIITPISVMAIPIAQWVTP